MPSPCTATSPATPRSTPSAIRSSTASARSTCCATTPGVAVLGPAERVEMDDWEWILQVNVLGHRPRRAGVRARRCSSGARPRLNTASVAGIVGLHLGRRALHHLEVRRLRAERGAGPAAPPPRASACRCCAPAWSRTNLGETARSSGVPEEHQGQWFYFPPEMLVAVEPEAVGVHGRRRGAGRAVRHLHPRQRRRDLQELARSTSTPPSPRPWRQPSAAGDPAG